MPTAGIGGAVFDQEVRQRREQAVVERPHQPPGMEARQEVGATPQSPPPTRWSRRTLRASVAAITDYSLSGVWRRLQRLLVRRRPLRDHLYRPDPDDLPKGAHLERCLREAARHPEAAVLVFVDERGSSRWPQGARDWMLALPGAAARHLHCTRPGRPTASSVSSAPAMR
jgi:hypothetical protein